MVRFSKEGYNSLQKVVQGIGGLLLSLEDYAGNDLQNVPCLVISYQMRTLLMSIKGFSELLFLKHGNDFPGDVLEYLHYIREASQKLERLLVSSIERQLQSCKRCKPVVPAEELVVNCCKIMENKADLRGVELAVRVLPGAKAVMVRDVLLTETLTGLLLFAVEMTPAGGRAGLACSPADRNVLFTVWHNLSPGWRMNERGYLGSSNNNLGKEQVLFLARELTKLNGGRFWVECTLGEVSSFRLLVPPAQTDENA